MLSEGVFQFFFERVIAFRLTIKVLQSSVKSVPPLSLYIYIYMDHMVPEVIAGEWMVISPSMTKGSSRCCPEMLRPFLKMGLSEDYEKLPLNILNRMEYHLREISIAHICIYIRLFNSHHFPQKHDTNVDMAQFYGTPGHPFLL